MQRCKSGFLLLSGDGKDISDVALETEELSSIIEKEEF